MPKPGMKKVNNGEGLSQLKHELYVLRSLDRPIVVGNAAFENEPASINALLLDFKDGITDEETCLELVQNRIEEILKAQEKRLKTQMDYADKFQAECIKKKEEYQKIVEKYSENAEDPEEAEYSEEALRKDDEIEKLQKEYDKAVLNVSTVRKLIGTFKAYSERLSKADKNMDVPETGLSQLVAGMVNRVVADTDKKAMATVNERNKKSQKSTYEKETIFDPDEARRDLIQEGYHEAGKELGAMILYGRNKEDGSVIDLFGIQRMSEEIDSELKRHEQLKKAPAGINAEDEERIRNSIHANLEQLEVELKRAGETEAQFTAGAYKKAIEKGWALSDLDMFAELNKYAERDDVQKRNTGKWLKDILDREIKSEADRHKALEDIEMQLADAPALPEGLTELVADSLSYQLQMGEEVHLENRQKIVPDIMDDLNAEDELNFDDEMFEDFEADMIAEAKKPEIKAKEENKEEKKEEKEEKNEEQKEIKAEAAKEEKKEEKQGEKKEAAEVKEEVNTPQQREFIAKVRKYMQGVKRRIDKFPRKEGKNAESYDTMVIMVGELAKLKDDAKFEDVEDRLRALKESAASYERSHHRVIPYYWNDYGKLRYNLSKEMESFGERRLNMAYKLETVDEAKIRNEWVVVDDMTFSNANVLGGINTNVAGAKEKDDSFSETIHIIQQEKAPGQPAKAPEKADEMIVEIENGVKYKMDKDGGFGAMSGGMLEEAPNERKEYDHTKVKIIDQGGLSDKEAREAIKKSGESWEKNFPAEARKRKHNKIDIREELKGKSFGSDHSRSSEFSYKKDRISHL